MKTGMFISLDGNPDTLLQDLREHVDAGDLLDILPITV